MLHYGKEYRKGQFIPESMYEDYLDYAFGRGRTLKGTTLWKDEYDRGFLCPSENSGWEAFAFDGTNHIYLGNFGDDIILQDNYEDNWIDHFEEMCSKADRSNSDEAVRILRDLYLDGRNKDEWTEIGVRIANDAECIDWITEYWSFVRWNNHGNESSFSEIGGFKGLIDCITEPEYVFDELSESIESGDVDAAALKDRLEQICHRYSTISSNNRKSIFEKYFKYFKR